MSERITKTASRPGPSVDIGGGGGGSALTIKDEGVNVDTATTSIDFVGDGVVASGPGTGAVTVTIPGITGNLVTGEAYLKDKSGNRTLTTQNTWYELTADAWTAGLLNSCTVNTPNGAITIGQTAKFNVLASISIDVDAPATIQMAVFVDGVQSNNLTQELEVSTGETDQAQAISISGVLSLSNTQVVKLQARCTSANNIIIRIVDANLAVSAIGGVDSSPASGAPVDAEYVCISNDATLTKERVLTAGTNVSIVDGGANAPVTISSSDTKGLQWTFNNALSGDPGAGKFLINNANKTLATQLNINFTSALAENLSAFVSTLVQGSNIYINKSNGDTAFYRVSGAVTVNASWVEIPVTYYGSAGGAFSNGSTYEVIIQSNNQSTDADFYNWTYVYGGIAAGDPTAGFFRPDSATKASVTNIRFNKEPYGRGEDIITYLKSLLPGDFLFLYATNGSTVLYKINSAVVDNTTYVSIPVTYITEGGTASFSVNDIFEIGITASGAAFGIISSIPTFEDDFVTEKPFWEATQAIEQGEWIINTGTQKIDGSFSEGGNWWIKRGIEGGFDYQMKVERNTATSVGFRIQNRANTVYAEISRISGNVQYDTSAISPTNAAVGNDTMWLRITWDPTGTARFYWKINDADAWTLLTTQTSLSLTHDKDLILTDIQSGIARIQRVILFDNMDTHMTRGLTSKKSYLVDAATIAIDASKGNFFTVTLGGSRTLGAPTNVIADGQKILIRVTQDGTGSRTLSYNAVYRFSTDLPSPTLSTDANAVDYLGFIYNEEDAKWDFVGKVFGF